MPAMTSLIGWPANGRDLSGVQFRLRFVCDNEDAALFCAAKMR
jgi:hypothetical protein